MEIKEEKIQRILNPTSIDLGDFVINPYKGCEYGCVYCYARFTSSAVKDKRQWGSYLDVRINAPEALEKELILKRPRKVLLGSITECFQPREAEYKITEKILDILNRHEIKYSILTRSPYITEYIHLLNRGFCSSVYFTVNNYPQSLRAVLEPKSPDFSARVRAVNRLLAEGLPVIPYFCPVLPFVSDYKDIFGCFPEARAIEFEALNFALGNIEEVKSAVIALYPGLGPVYRALSEDKAYYDIAWQSIKQDAEALAQKAAKECNFRVHAFRAYFNNKYI